MGAQAMGMCCPRWTEICKRSERRKNGGCGGVCFLPDLAIFMRCWWPAKKCSWRTDAHSLDRDAVCADDGDVLSALDENAQEGMSAEEIADVTVLRARVKHLEMQQSLMDGELESMSELAKQTNTQLRSALI